MTSAMPCSPNAAFMAENVSSPTRFVSSSSEQKRCSAASFGCIDFGRSPAAIAATIAGIEARRQRGRLVRVPFVVRRPMASGHEDRHLAQRRRQRGVEADLRPELLGEVAHERRAQHDVERPVRRRSRAVENVAHHGLLLLRELRPRQRRKPIADELEVRGIGLGSGCRGGRALRGEIGPHEQRTQAAEPRDDESTTHG